MDYKYFACFIILGLCLGFCQGRAIDNIADYLRIIWTVETNSPTCDPDELPRCEPLLPYEGALILEYKGDTAELDLDWEIYFCAIRILFPTIITEENPDVGVVFPGSNIIVHHVNGCLHRIRPLANFTGLWPNIPIFLLYKASDWSVARTDVMPNWYVAADSGEAKTILSTAGQSLDFVAAYDAPEKWKRIVQEDQYNPYTPEQRFDMNSAADRGSSGNRIIPTPSQLIIDDTIYVDLSTGDWVVVYTDPGLQPEAEYLAERLEISAVGDGEYPSGRYIELNNLNALESVESNMYEAYDLKVLVDDQKINISGGSNVGVFHGIQTLLSLHSYSPQIPSALIVDFPRFPYRGMHLDVSRNFISKVEVLRLLGVMAMYKMNKFHFHLTDDEGWRLEIPTLPELTETGSKRCFSTDPDECLISQLGSGPTTSTSGSGFYTVDDYQEILAFADKRHIQVIPEFDMPGHGYAAIKSMEARYNKYKDTDMEAAKKYLLADFNDNSTYLSAQIYRDNAINPCIESTYEFVKELVQQVKAIHQDIQPLEIFHFGGDEVAEGAWLKSQACQELVDARPDLVPSLTREHLHTYFVLRVADIVNDENLHLGGWEDGLGFGTSPINRTDVPNEKVLVHAWNNIWEEGNGERAYSYANEGYEVVISHATHFYFDHPQEPDPEERGYYWATRFADTYKTFGYMPDDVYSNIDTTRMGVPIDRDEYCAAEGRCIPLEQPSNILGIQGQLFSETCRTPSQLHSQVYPRIIALAERAWHKSIWEDSKDPQWKATDWENFANNLAYKELDRLQRLGIQYYVPPPGARITTEGGIYYLEVNTRIAGLPIVFSTDGGQTWSTIKSGVKTEIEAETVVDVQVRSADSSRGSRIISLQTSGALSSGFRLNLSGMFLFCLVCWTLII